MSSIKWNASYFFKFLFHYVDAKEIDYKWIKLNQMNFCECFSYEIFHLKINDKWNIVDFLKEHEIQ
jgi:hypothetical protein